MPKTYSAFLVLFTASCSGLAAIRRALCGGAPRLPDADKLPDHLRTDVGLPAVAPPPSPTLPPLRR